MFTFAQGPRLRRLGARKALCHTMEKKQDVTTESVSTGTARLMSERRQQSEFMVACASGDLAKVEEMLADGADPNQVSDLGGTPLTWAVAWDREDVVECLLGFGAEVDFPVRPARTPLMHAASRGNHRIVAMLIAHGADLFRADETGLLPVDLAIDAGHVQCAFLLELFAQLARPLPRCPSLPRVRRHCGGRRRWMR